jgi:hypothetical protein
MMLQMTYCYYCKWLIKSIAIVGICCNRSIIKLFFGHWMRLQMKHISHCQIQNIITTTCRINQSSELSSCSRSTTLGFSISRRRRGGWGYPWRRQAAPDIIQTQWVRWHKASCQHFSAYSNDSRVTQVWQMPSVVSMDMACSSWSHANMAG